MLFIIFLRDQFYKLALIMIRLLISLFNVFFSSFDKVEIMLIALKKVFIPKIDCIFIATYFMKSIHIKLSIKNFLLDEQKIRIFHV